MAAADALDTRAHLIKIALFECVKGDFDGGLRTLQQLGTLDESGVFDSSQIAHI